MRIALGGLSISFFGQENWQRRFSCDGLLSRSKQSDKSRKPAYKFAIMGVGRRMQKQGPPEALSEAHYANLKRKMGLPVDDTPTEAAPSSKRRRAAKTEKPNKKVATSKANGTKKAPGAPLDAHRVGKPKAKKAAAPAPDSDEEMDDEFDVSNMDDVSGSDLDEAKLGSDFLGSDDDSVYDSDEGVKKEKFVFSDDEDEDDDDREERLTAANIEGLSRKLDQKLADEAAENEAELRDGALQTNIEGDKPNILGDDDDDELAAKAQTLLAPDLQMLRTRITETIRVLEDFSNLAEEGRSRTEYTGQLLKDVCACMSPLLLPLILSIWPRQRF